MIASFLKLLPFLQLLLEAFKPGDGENVTRAGKITTLAIVLILTYTSFVTYAYIVQYHSLVQVREHDQYMERQYNDKNKTVELQGDELRTLYGRIFECLGRSPGSAAYESGQPKPADKPVALVPPVVVPETPVHAEPKVQNKQAAASKPVGVVDMSNFRMEILKNINEE